MRNDHGARNCSPSHMLASCPILSTPSPRRVSCQRLTKGRIHDWVPERLFRSEHSSYFTTRSSFQRVVKRLESISRFMRHFCAVPTAAEKRGPRPKRELMAPTVAENFDTGWSEGRPLKRSPGDSAFVGANHDHFSNFTSSHLALPQPFFLTFPCLTTSPGRLAGKNSRQLCTTSLPPLPRHPRQIALAFPCHVFTPFGPDDCEPSSPTDQSEHLSSPPFPLF
jgi:hypothetical protein